MTIKTVNSVVQYKNDPDYAKMLIKEIQEDGITMVVIAKRAGVHTRTLYRAMELGFTTFPVQLTIESMAGRR